MEIDPRRVAAIQVQIDALAHDTRDHPDPEVHRAIHTAKAAISKAHAVLAERGLFLQIPDGYEPPTGLGMRGSKEGR